MRYLVGIGLWLLWLVLMVLKVTGVADLSWTVVFAPLWAPVVLTLLGSGLALLWLLGEMAFNRGSKTRS